MIPPLTKDGLLPPGRYICTLNNCQHQFVDPYPDTNRRLLFDKWIAYTERLQTMLLGIGMLQWIDGSFVSDKPNPCDIDIVTFIPYRAYEASEDQLVEFYSTVTLHEKGLDAYICPVYPSKHVHYTLYCQFRDNWQRLFESHRTQVGAKGFLEVTL